MEDSHFLPSLVIPYGAYSSEKCGYCKGKAEGLHTTWGMSAKRLTVTDYQYMIDRGWRRSGTYCYKPLNEVTCCPCYTIRCNALDFRPSRSQKRLLKMVASFLKTGEVFAKTHTITEDWRSDPIELHQKCTGEFVMDAKGDVPSSVKTNSRSGGDKKLRVSPPSSDICKPVQQTELSCVLPTGDSAPHVDTADKRTHIVKSRARRWEAKLTRLKTRASKEDRPVTDLLKEYEERRQRRLKRNQPKELEELLNLEPSKGTSKHFLEVRLVRSSPPSPDFQATLETSHALYQKYQMAVHGDNPTDCEFAQFRRFLVKSPLVPDQALASDLCSESDETPPTFGSYHQQYWLDGERLIAVGVVDLLPQCLSSVYFFYDPDYSFLKLGTFSALREIAFVRELARKFGPNSTNASPLYVAFDWYYMGYFIRSCPKMAYKAQFHPSYLACPESYVWVPVDECILRLSQSPNGKYARFSDEFARDPSLDSLPDEDDELDRQITCYISRQAACSESNPHSRPSATRLGICLKLEQIRPHLNHSYLTVLREWARMMGQRVLTGHFQVFFT
ncbi:Arginyl-tRNA--protein transferase 1 [Paragonimus heterotremus]|uniref:Arginyl-tRNA--protein transferase 1 n=1 Tax=Paragonimus heterotremus TaxID=100268 RepID=A0A8J4WY98_9TREM|nr:Arginyl-tRNA--protein transferase 1 [Paragonimus heterotremus]